MPQSFSHCTILSPLGAGGVGEVYKARDTQLDRDVALKILPEAFARDPERLARFEREARVLAQLNHTNIASMYSLAREGEKVALALEYVEGEGLTERIAAWEKLPPGLPTPLRRNSRCRAAARKGSSTGIVGGGVHRGRPFAGGDVGVLEPGRDDFAILLCGRAC